MSIRRRPGQRRKGYCVTEKQKEKWAFAVMQAMSDYVPQWPSEPTDEQVEAQAFFMGWLAELGFKIWDC